MLRSCPAFVLQPARTLLALTLTACGQATSLPAPTNAPDISPNSLAAFAHATSTAGSARIAMTMKVPSDSGTILMKANGKFTTNSPVSGEMSLALSGNNSKQIRMQEKILWPVIYMRSRVFRQAIPGSKPWLKIDVKKLPGGNALDALAGASNNNTDQALAYLRGASSDVQNLGTSKVRGVTTTHYRAQINFAKVLKNMTPKDARCQPLRDPPAVDRDRQGDDADGLLDRCSRAPAG